MAELKMNYPSSFNTFGEAIPPQYAIQVLDELTNESFKFYILNLIYSIFDQLIIVLTEFCQIGLKIHSIID